MSLISDQQVPAVALDHLEVAVLSLGDRPASRRPSTPESAITELSGVRSSWLMLERKALLSRLASSSCCFCISSSAFCSVSSAACAASSRFCASSSRFWCSSRSARILDLPEGQHAVDAGGQHAPDLVDQPDGRRVVGADAGQRDHRGDGAAEHGDGQDLARRELPAHRGEGEARVRRDVGDALDRRVATAAPSSPSSLRGGEGGAAAGAQADRLEMLEGGLRVVQEIDRPDLRAGVLEQRLEQLAAERVRLVFPEHDAGKSRDLFRKLHIGLNLVGKPVKRFGERTELIGRHITAPGVKVAPPVVFRCGGQFSQRAEDAFEQDITDPRREQHDHHDGGGQLHTQRVLQLPGVLVKFIAPCMAKSLNFWIWPISLST